MAENSKASRMAKLKAILNADAAIITILLAVGGGIIHVTNQIATLQTTSDNHTKQIDDLNASHATSDAKMDWLLRQLDLMRAQMNAPRPTEIQPVWPSVPQAEQPIASQPKPKHSLFEPQELPKQASVKRSQLAGGLLNPDQK